MQSRVRAEALKELLDHRPFTPLIFHLSDGERLKIGHPEQAVVTRSLVMVPLEVSSDGIIERVRWINLLHIVKVEQSANGRAPPRKRR